MRVQYRLPLDIWVSADQLVKVEDINLTTTGQKIRLHPTAWMADNILAVEGYCRRKVVHMVLVLDRRAFDIQRIYNNWLTISTVGAADGMVNIYDSLYLSHVLKTTLQLL